MQLTLNNLCVTITLPDAQASYLLQNLAEGQQRKENSQPIAQPELSLETQARIIAESEVANRRYTMNAQPTSGLGYDDRLTMRLGCSKTKVYELLAAYTNGHEGGLRHQRVGRKYVISEQAVREWFGDSKKQL